MKKLYRDVLDYVGTTVLLKAVGIVSVLYVGAALVPAEFGYFAVASIVIAFGATLAEFGASGLMVRDYGQKGAWVLLNALPLVLLVWAVECLALLVASAAVGRSETLRVVAEHPVLLAVSILTTVGNTLVGAYLVVALEARVFALSTAVKSLTQLPVAVVLVSYAPSYTALLYATLAGGLGFFAVPLVRFRSDLRRGWRGVRAGRGHAGLVAQARDGAVFLSREALAVVQAQWSRIVLTACVPVSDLGVYTFFFTIAGSVGELGSSVERAYTPRLVRAYQGDAVRTGHLLSSLVPAAVLALAAIYVGIVGAGEVGVYQLLLRPEYVARATVLDAMLFIAVTGAIGQIFYYSYYVGRANTSIRTHALAHLAVSVTLQLALIPTYGLRGAVAAELIAAGLRLDSLWLINYRILIAGTTFRAAVTLLAFVTAVCVLLADLVMAGGGWGLFAGGIAALAAVYAALSGRELRRFSRLLHRTEGIATIATPHVETVRS